MSKYRIKRVDKDYFVQFRSFSNWLYLRDLYGTVRSFDSEEEARRYIIDSLELEKNNKMLK